MADSWSWSRQSRGWALALAIGAVNASRTRSSEVLATAARCREAENAATADLAKVMRSSGCREGTARRPPARCRGGDCAGLLGSCGRGLRRSGGGLEQIRRGWGIGEGTSTAWRGRRSLGTATQLRLPVEIPPCSNKREHVREEQREKGIRGASAGYWPGSLGPTTMLTSDEVRRRM